MLRENAVEEAAPLFITNFILQIPNIVISPDIEELQNYFAKVVTNVIETHKGIIMWGQRNFLKEEKTLETEKSKLFKKHYNIV